MKTILLAEDNAFISDVYAIYLKKEGYAVDIAADGQMALDKINNAPPDLLVLDLDLPKVNGCDVLKTLRKDPKTKNLKVIIASNHDQGDFCPECANLGISKYFVKIQTSPEEIKNAVKEILQ